MRAHIILAPMLITGLPKCGEMELDSTDLGGAWKNALGGFTGRMGLPNPVLTQTRMNIK